MSLDDRMRALSLENRIQTSVSTALVGLRTQVEKDMREIVDQLVAAATTEQAELTAAAAAEQEKRAATAASDQEKAVANARQTTLKEANERSQRELAAALAETDARLRATADREVADARAVERQIAMEGVTRLLESVRGLDGATTLTEVLDALGVAASREASRAAVFVLRSDRAIGWKLSGFGDRDGQPRSIDIGLTECGRIDHAVGSARPVTTRESKETGAPAFAELPNDRMGLAVPVIVGGRVVAIVYADSGRSEGEHHVPSGWEMIEVLARHAARCLEALTVQKAATAAAPRLWAPPVSATPGMTA
jgi:hypothetical protein